MSSFSAGAVLSRTFSIWLRNIVPFSILCIIVYIPDFAFGYGAIKNNLFGMSILTFAFVQVMLRSLLNLIATAAITYGVVMQLRGTTPSIGGSVGIGLSRALAVLGTSLLAGLAIVGGFILLVVPGIMIMCALYVAVPVAIVEKPGATAALRRSATLTSGHRGSIFGIVFVLGLLGYVVQRILMTISGSGSSESQALTGFVLTGGVSAILSALGATAAGVAYHDLRSAKEGVDVAQLAAVFD
jgi:hypothetical protein